MDKQRIQAAKSIQLPKWATHVAVSTTREPIHAEPCRWIEEAQEFVDENPAGQPPGTWTGAYKQRYWVFFSREDLNN